MADILLPDRDAVIQFCCDGRDVLSDGRVSGDMRIFERVLKMKKFRVISINLNKFENEFLDKSNDDDFFRNLIQ